MSRPSRATEAGRAYLDLQNRARREQRGTQELLTMYVVERWLARLARSRYADHFVLKGGVLLAAFGQRRPTADADALARGMITGDSTIARSVAEIAAIELEDGVSFDHRSLVTRPIREEATYPGTRVALPARIATAQVGLRVDINLGDPVTPAPQVVELPSLRPSLPAVAVLGYPIESVLAEKIASAVDLGPANTRVRDYADIWTLTGHHDVSLAAVRQALAATAHYRRMQLRALSEVIGRLVVLRSAAYDAYRAGLGSYGEHLPVRFVECVEDVIAFVDPLVTSEAVDRRWVSARRGWDR